MARPRKTTPRVRVRNDGTTYSQVCYRIERSGKIVQTSQSFDDHRAAIRWAKLLDRVGPIEAERVLAAQLAADPDVVTLKVWLHRYVDSLGKSVEEETKRKYRRMIDRDMIPFFGEFLPVDALTPELDAAWVDWLETEFGNKPKTVRNKHGLLCAAMGAAARKRPTPLIPWNPCAETKLPKCSARETDHLDELEYELIEQLLEPFWHPWWEFGVMSMARPGEQGALKVGDINRDTGAVSIVRAWKWANGRMKLGDPKTERGIRTTFVPLETVGRLDLDDRPADAWLFLTPTGLPVTSVRFWQQGWAPALERLDALVKGDRTPFTGAAGWGGLSFDELQKRYGRIAARLKSKRLTPYTTRHTGISWRLQDGEPIWVVSRDAGHSSITITDRRYGHNSTAASAASAQVIAGRLPRLRSNVVSIVQARRRRLVQLGKLGEIERVAGGFEAVWMDERGLVQSAVFDSYDHAVDHVAQHEAGDVLAAAA
ncbi:tyrosine-type recombinase/integrase [Nocardia brasiliensis]|uniref:tyrosine-type recombinase/integrase n=1 Tax=Nocardia brasiliensis TaxID=37326 RepID=UPI003670EBE8